MTTIAEQIREAKGLLTEETWIKNAYFKAKAVVQQKVKVEVNEG